MLYCGQVEERERRLAHHPELENESREANEWLEDYTHQYAESRGDDDEVYIIPVVFHVIHNNGAENISDAQIWDGLQILNRDFRKLNTDIAQVVDEFASITADIGIEFRAATRDPNGYCTNGINRIQSNLTYSGNEEMKSLIFWPRNKYLNVWICADASGAAGYTNMPGDVNNLWNAASDGIVVRADYVGSIGTSSISKSRTLTHEVGHWLNLYHCWGQSNTPGAENNCNMDDYVSDTPNTIGYYTCNLNGSSCGSTLDNVQNYMEYSYCTRMFTQGQRTRMRAAITSSVAQRKQLITQNNLIQTGVNNPTVCQVDFLSDVTTACAGTEIHFSDASYNQITQWSWDFGDGEVMSGNDPALYQNPTHSYAAEGIYSVTLTAGNATGSMMLTKNNMIRILGQGELATPFFEGFESSWPENRWLIENPDGNYTWEVTPGTHFSGTKSLKLRNYYNSLIDNSDALVSSTFDMSAMDTIYLSYRWAYSNKLTATDDRLRVSVSADCGKHWVVKRSRRGLTNLPTAPASASSFIPSDPDEWSGEEVVITEPEMMSDVFRVKFEFIGKGGNNIFLDDINISGSAAVTTVSSIAHDPLFKVYPNPSNGDVTLEWDRNERDSPVVTLWNCLGQQCSKAMIEKRAEKGNQIIIPHQSPGVYLLRFEQAGKTFLRKIVFE